MNKIWENYGHTYQNHVEVNDYELKERLVFGTYDTGKYDDTPINFSSRFLNEEIALKGINIVLKQNKEVIDDWMKNQYAQKITVRLNFLQQVGVGFAKNTSWKTPYALYSIIVVLKADCHFHSYEIVTAYPFYTPKIQAQIKKDKMLFMNSKTKKQTK